MDDKTVISEEEMEELQEILSDPPEPTQYLVKAMKEYSGDHEEELCTKRK